MTTEQPARASAPRVALVWAGPDRLTTISVRYERYVAGLRALGEEPVTVCTAEAAQGYPFPVRTVASTECLRDPHFWQTQGIRTALVITWLVLPEIVAALKQAGIRVVSIADSDGRIGARVHPAAVLRRLFVSQPTWNLRLRACKFFAQMYCQTTPASDGAVLASAGAADRIAVCSPRAVEHLRRFFHHYRRPDLAAKVVSVPYPIDSCYLTEPVANDRANRLVSIGRWDDPQKDAGLLCRAVEHYYRLNGAAEVALVGPGGAPYFEGLARRWPRVRYLGVQSPDTVAELLRGSRSLLLPSRWESGPIVLNEALASGCSVVGTDTIPSVLSACREGPYGTVSHGRSARRLARAMREEEACWDTGRRDPRAIAAYWRPRFTPEAVCKQLLDEGTG